MKKLILIPTILTVLATLGAFPMAFAAHSLPFNGSFSGSFTLKMAATQTAAITGTGHFEHLGKVTFANSATGTGSSTACQGGITANEQEIFTAANGDKLFSSAKDLVCPTSQTAFQLTASFTITSGTGRFAHASGSGTTQISGVFTSMTTGTLSGTFTGTISY